MGIFQKQIARLRSERKARETAKQEALNRAYQKAEEVCASIVNDIPRVQDSWHIDADGGTVKMRRIASSDTIEIVCKPDSFDIVSSMASNLSDLTEDQMAEHVLKALGFQA